MTFHVSPSLVLKALAFTLATAPMVIYNLRTGRIPNHYNAIILLVGIGVLTLAPILGMPGFSLHNLAFWLLSTIVLLVFYKMGWIQGGATKFLIAMLPWLSPSEYLPVTSCGFIVAGVIALVLRYKDTQIAPPVAVCGLIALVADVVASTAH